MCGSFDDIFEQVIWHILIYMESEGLRVYVVLVYLPLVTSAQVVVEWIWFLRV